MVPSRHRALICSLITILSAALLKDYTNKDISAEYDEAKLPPMPVAAAE
jgi:hypothetical protein